MSVKSEMLTIEGNHSGTPLNLEKIVERAVQGIAPLWPLTQFAARSPWMNLETEPFHRVAEYMKRSQGVNLYPGAAMIRAARQRGDIEARFVDRRLQQWLDSELSQHPLRKEAETFCRSVLMLKEAPDNLASDPVVKQIASALDLDVSFIDRFHVRPLTERYDSISGRDTSHLVDHQAIKWCKLYLDESEAVWALPYREDGFYVAWRHLIEKDPAVPKVVRKRLSEWPMNAVSALRLGLHKLQVPAADVESYLREHLLSLPGWAGMLYWRAQRSEFEKSLILDYLAIRISLEWALLAPHLPLPAESRDASAITQRLIGAWKYHTGMAPGAWLELSPEEQNVLVSIADRFNTLTAQRIWLEAWEDTESARLQQLLTGQPDTLAKTYLATTHPLDIVNHTTSNEDAGYTDTPSAQFVFCIDVRSEPYRRRLERSGPFETYGAAGFFALPVAVKSLGNDHAHASLPVILSPKHLIVEYAVEAFHEPFLERRDALYSVPQTFKTVKQSTLGSLLLPEVTGFWMALHMIARTFLPRSSGKAIRSLKSAWLKKPGTKFSIDVAESAVKEPNLPVQAGTDDTVHGSAEDADLKVSSVPLKSPLSCGIPDDLKVEYARQFLESIGLTKDFAPIVVLCGHGSQTTNNPYEAKLDCGACGGASGAHNARILATICNEASVRAGLEDSHIHIPEETVFLAAEHVTTLDTLRWLDVPSLPAAAKSAFEQVNRALPTVQKAAIKERLREVPFASKQIEVSVREAERLSEDWSEVRPEWGLARNTAFVIGHRNLTRSCNLEGRVFLHSYDWRADSDGHILNAILSGPGTVAQWINLQYYASTVAPGYYGAGSKTTQSVTAGLGVMQGNGSDLLTGVPWQSVMQSDEEPYHDPLRLLIVIEAPRTRVAEILERNLAFRRKVQNGWVRLATVDPSGQWENWNSDTLVNDDGLQGVSHVSYSAEKTRPVFTS